MEEGKLSRAFNSEAFNRKDFSLKNMFAALAMGINAAGALVFLIQKNIPMALALATSAIAAIPSFIPKGSAESPGKQAGTQSPPSP